MLRRNLLHPRDQCGAHLSGRTANHIRSCPTASRIQIEQISFSIRRPFEKMTVLDPRPTPAVQQLVSDTFHYAASERRFFYVHRRASPAMKERATVLCQRGDRILLVARPRARWVLPGGKPRSSETLSDAARRELTEETGIGSRHPQRRLARQRIAIGLEPAHGVQPIAGVIDGSWGDRLTRSILCERSKEGRPVRKRGIELCLIGPGKRRHRNKIT